MARLKEGESPAGRPKPSFRRAAKKKTLPALKTRLSKRLPDGLYDVLGLRQGASRAAIVKASKSQRRALLRERRQARRQQRSAVSMKLQRVEEAARILNDANFRAQYDEAHGFISPGASTARVRVHRAGLSKDRVRHMRARNVAAKRVKRCDGREVPDAEASQVLLRRRGGRLESARPTIANKTFQLGRGQGMDIFRRTRAERRKDRRKVALVCVRGNLQGWV